MGFFGFYASPRGDNSLEAVEAAVQKQIDKLLADGGDQDYEASQISMLVP